jgi:hypothetical protein
MPSWCRCASCQQIAARAEDPYTGASYGAEYLSTPGGLVRVMSVDDELLPWDGVERRRYPVCADCGFPRGGGHADDCRHARPWQRR